MIAGIPIGFTAPLMLLGLLSLPLLWLLLRVTPPRPRQVAFPPTRLLFDIAPKEETPARTPWWLTLLRLGLAALLILAVAGPVLNPPPTQGAGTGPVVVLIDDGVTAAASFPARLRNAEDVVSRAEAAGRPIAVVPMSDHLREIPVGAAGAARDRLRTLAAKPHVVDRGDILAPLGRFVTAVPDADFVWLSDGADHGGGAEFLNGLTRTLNGRPLTVYRDGLPTPLALAGSENAAGSLSVVVSRLDGTAPQTGRLRGLDLKGLPVAEAGFTFGAGERETTARFDLPVELRNDIARIDIIGETSAGAVQLLDKRWRRRSVGIVSGATADTAQPLLAATYYLTRALGPFADLRPGEPGSPGEAIRKLVEAKVPVLVLADVGTITPQGREPLVRWLEAGGVLIRFAGPRLAAAEEDLVPVKLRRGGRSLGGSMSWEQPQALASFGRESPFAGLTVPPDVRVTRQVLAEPDSVLLDRTWAALTDGTPLVTAEKRGKGMIVLFHVTADTRWSDLPLSGVFVDMLRRVVALADAGAAAEAAAGGASQEAIPPTRVLDGTGAFTTPPPTARPIPANYAARATADHPPGFYGPPDGLVAVNTFRPADRLTPLDLSPLGARIETYRTGEKVDLRAPLFIGGLILLLVDALVVFWLGGGFQRLAWRRPVRPAVLALAVAGLVAALPGGTRADDTFAMRNTHDTRIAYVLTGDSETDAISRAGLAGLSQFLAQRTALEPGEPVGVDIARDELSFFSLIYWPVSTGAGRPEPATLARIDAFMKNGGTVLFDTRDAMLAPPGQPNQGPGMVALRSILSALDIPDLEPVPKEHVLTKTFFLLKDFPGRYTDGTMWVEALPEPDPDEEDTRPARGGDGVSSVIITSNDLAGAWAVRQDGAPMLPLVPGEPRQREFAYRVGANIIMYVLTGNYKADQVHVPALLERLGQ
jgi:hypothetical protein